MGARAPHTPHPSSSIPNQRRTHLQLEVSPTITPYLVISYFTSLSVYHRVKRTPSSCRE